MIRSAHNRPAEKAKRDELYKLFKAYVLHKKKIINHSRSDWYRKEGVLQSLDILTRYIDVLKSYKLQGICRVILNKQEHLRNILPVHNNPSFKSSENKLNQLIHYATKYLA